MRADIIIAARGEKPENLTRTVENVRATLGRDDGLRVLLDGLHPGEVVCPGTSCVPFTLWDRPRGCGQTRHHGITTSAAKYVVLIDGHMEFPPGWVDAICRHLARHPRDITCTRNRSVRPDWTPYGEIDSGAHLHLHTTGPQTDIGGPVVEYHGLSAKWNAGALAGPVAAPMGACYGMRRDWYAKIGAPLGLLEAWGCDEELLGVCGWLCGGRTYCLPIGTRHMYAAPRVNRAVDARDIWANRMAMLLAIPGIPDETIRYVRQTRLDWPYIDALVAARRDRIEALRAHLAKQRRTFAGMVKAGLVKVNPATIQAPPAPVARSQPRHALMPAACDRCGHGGLTPHVAVGEVYARCGSCGHRRRVA